MSEQSELDLTPTAKIKARQLEALRTPHSVVVDFDSGELVERQGQELLAIGAEEQWAVRNPRWLERLRRAMDNYRQMLEQHARERGVVQAVVYEILKESRQLTEADMPKREQPADRVDPEWARMNDERYLEDDEVPF